VDNKCFALLQNGRCSALNDSQGCGERCAFYKTAEQLREERRRAMERLAGLDLEYRLYIADKYHLSIPIKVRHVLSNVQKISGGVRI